MSGIVGPQGERFCKGFRNVTTMNPSSGTTTSEGTHRKSHLWGCGLLGGIQYKGVKNRWVAGKRGRTARAKSRN